MDKNGKRIADDGAGELDGQMNTQPGKRVEKRPAEKLTLRRFWKEWGDVVVLLAVVFVLLRFVFQIAFVPSGSMETTLPTKSLLISWRVPYVLGDPLPERGEVITFWSDELGKVLVKRVIGLPGDTIRFEGGYVYRNDEKLEETYLPVQGASQADGVFTVPEGCFFVLGDNRPGSLDARYWAQPYIPVSKIQAKVLLAASVGKNQSWQGIHIIAGR